MSEKQLSNSCRPSILIQAFIRYCKSSYQKKKNNCIGCKSENTDTDVAYNDEYQREGDPIFKIQTICNDCGNISKTFEHF